MAGPTGRTRPAFRGIQCSIDRPALEAALTARIILIDLDHLTVRPTWPCSGSAGAAPRGPHPPSLARKPLRCPPHARPFTFRSSRTRMRAWPTRARTHPMQRIAPQNSATSGQDGTLIAPIRFHFTHARAHCRGESPSTAPYRQPFRDPHAAADFNTESMRISLNGTHTLPSEVFSISPTSRSTVTSS